MQLCMFGTPPLAMLLSLSLCTEAMCRYILMSSLFSNEAGTPSVSSSTQSPSSEASTSNQAQLAPSLRTLSPDASDRIFPARSLVNVEPQPHSPRTGSSSSVRGNAIPQDSVVGTPVIEDSGPWQDPATSLSASDSTRDPVVGEELDQVPFITARHRHVVSEDGHMIIAGIDGAESIQRCEDEPIHIPGAVQGFGCMVALREGQEEGTLDIRVVSEVCSPARVSVNL